MHEQRIHKTLWHRCRGMARSVLLTQLLNEVRPWSHYWVSVILCFASVFIGSTSFTVAVTFTLANLACCCLPCRGRKPPTAHALRVSSFTLNFIVWHQIKNERTITPLEKLVCDYMFLLWIFVALSPWLIQHEDANAIGRSPRCLSDVRGRWCLCIVGVLLQVMFAGSAAALLLTSACVPEIYSDWFLLPSDCTRAMLEERYRQQFLASVLSPFYTVLFVASFIWDVIKSPATRKQPEGHNQQQRFRISYKMLLRTGMAACFAYPLIHLYFVFSPLTCSASTRLTTLPQDLPRLHVNDSVPSCHPELDTHGVIMSKVTTWGKTGQMGGVGSGGVWRPSHCTPIQRVALVVPYRLRESQLIQFLATIHPFLQQQQLQYRIVVVEQAGEHVFNRGKLMNVGFLEAEKLGDFDCFIFHDVDLIPERQDNLYLCDKHPRHLCPAVNALRYSIYTNSMFGGAVALTGPQFRLLNGFGNVYWGWGGEDDDLSARIFSVGYMKTQPPNHVGRYIMLPHKKHRPSPGRHPLLLTWQNRWMTDGLSNLRSGDYKVISRRDLPLYTHILADIGSPASNIDALVRGPRLSAEWWKKYEC